MALLIGLTGGIASGKTTVADLFQQHFDIEIVDADIVAREVVEIGTSGLKHIVEHFGQSMLSSEGNLNRQAFRERIFSHPDEREWLNNLLHPMIHQRMVENLSHVQSPYALLVVPLLIENNLQSMADRVLVVDVEPELQIQRTMERDNISRIQAENILASQTQRQTRLQHADDVVLNGAERDTLLPQITQLHQQYLAMCEPHSGTKMAGR